MVTEIKNGIYYVGVNDRNKHRFEGLWPLPNGVSYNSYVIVDEKVTLVDTVEVDFFTQFLENIKEVIGNQSHGARPQRFDSSHQEVLSQHQDSRQQEDLRYAGGILWRDR